MLDKSVYENVKELKIFNKHQSKYIIILINQNYN